MQLNESHKAYKENIFIAYYLQQIIFFIVIPDRRAVLIKSYIYKVLFALLMLVVGDVMEKLIQCQNC